MADKKRGRGDDYLSDGRSASDEEWRTSTAVGSSSNRPRSHHHQESGPQTRPRHYHDSSHHTNHYHDYRHPHSNSSTYRHRSQYPQPQRDYYSPPYHPSHSTASSQYPQHDYYHRDRRDGHNSNTPYDNSQHQRVLNVQQTTNNQQHNRHSYHSHDLPPTKSNHEIQIVNHYTLSYLNSLETYGEQVQENVQLVLILCGIPGCGKSTLSKRIIHAINGTGESMSNPLRLVHINQDVVKRRSIVEQYMQTALLQKEQSVIIDRCNFNEEQRNHWIQITNLRRKDLYHK